MENLHDEASTTRATLEGAGSLSLADVRKNQGVLILIGSIWLLCLVLHYRNDYMAQREWKEILFSDQTRGNMCFIMAHIALRQRRLHTMVHFMNRPTDDDVSYDRDHRDTELDIKRHRSTTRIEKAELNQLNVNWRTKAAEAEQLGRLTIVTELDQQRDILGNWWSALKNSTNLLSALCERECVWGRTDALELLSTLVTFVFVPCFFAPEPETFLCDDDRKETAFSGFVVFPMEAITDMRQLLPLAVGFLVGFVYGVILTAPILYLFGVYSRCEADVASSDQVHLEWLLTRAHNLPPLRDSLLTDLRAVCEARELTETVRFVLMKQEELLRRRLFTPEVEDRQIMLEGVLKELDDLMVVEESLDIISAKGNFTPEQIKKMEDSLTKPPIIQSQELVDSHISRSLGGGLRATLFHALFVKDRRPFLDWEQRRQALWWVKVSAWICMVYLLGCSFYIFLYAVRVADNNMVYSILMQFAVTEYWDSIVFMPVSTFVVSALIPYLVAKYVFQDERPHNDMKGETRSSGGILDKIFPRRRNAALRASHIAPVIDPAADMHSLRLMTPPTMPDAPDFLDSRKIDFFSQLKLDMHRNPELALRTIVGESDLHPSASDEVGNAADPHAIQEVNTEHPELDPLAHEILGGGFRSTGGRSRLTSLETESNATKRTIIQVNRMRQEHARHMQRREQELVDERGLKSRELRSRLDSRESCSSHGDSRGPARNQEASFPHDFSSFHPSQADSPDHEVDAADFQVIELGSMAQPGSPGDLEWDREQGLDPSSE